MFNSELMKVPEQSPGRNKSIVFEEMIHTGQHFRPTWTPPPAEGGDITTRSTLNALRVLYMELDAGMRLIKMWKDKWPDQTSTIQGMLSYLDVNVWRLCEFIENAKKNAGFNPPAAGTPAGKIYETILQCKYEAWCYVLEAVSSGDYTPPNDPQGKPKTHVGPESEKKKWKDEQETAGYDVDRKG